MDSKQILNNLEQLQFDINHNIQGELQQQLEPLLQEAWQTLFHHINNSL